MIQAHADFRSHQIQIRLRGIPALESKSLYGLSTSASMVRTETRYGGHKINIKNHGFCSLHIKLSVVEPSLKSSFTLMETQLSLNPLNSENQTND